MKVTYDSKFFRNDSLKYSPMGKKHLASLVCSSPQLFHSYQKNC